MQDIDLVLSGGGIRGLAHVGVIKALLAKGYRIKRIAGCSIGALIGAMYASQKDITSLEDFCKNVKFYQWHDLTLPTHGLLTGEKIEKKVAEYIKVKRFEDLQIPLIINATDAQTGEEVIFDKGKIMEPLRASMSFPGLLTPARLGDRILIDGGVVNPVPISLLDKQRLVIISDVISPLRKDVRKAKIVDMVYRSLYIGQHALVEEHLKHTPHNYLLIQPDVSEWDVLDIKNDPLIIKRGEEAVLKGLSER